jgi:pyridoxal phosphate enzyme (YggS family)
MIPQIQANLAEIKTNIQRTCQQAGRQPAEVTLIAVTKYVGLAAISALLTAGQRDLGESRVQQLMTRVELLDGGSLPAPRWHMIGHLQRNKVKYLLPQVRIIHSVDSLKLAETISEHAQRHDCTTEIFIEANTSGETAKHGVALAELDSLLEACAGLPGTEICGLMTMAPQVEQADQARPFFAQLRAALANARQCGSAPDTCRYLSMGMSSDYTAAIAEGATHIRIGSALFSGLNDADRVQETPIMPPAGYVQQSEPIDQPEPMDPSQPADQEPQA